MFCRVCIFCTVCASRGRVERVFFVGRWPAHESIGERFGHLPAPYAVHGPGNPEVPAALRLPPLWIRALVAAGVVLIHLDQLEKIDDRARRPGRLN